MTWLPFQERIGHTALLAFILFFIGKILMGPGVGEDDPLGEIGRMISDTLEVFGDHQKIQSLVTVVDILVNEGDQLGFDHIEQLIHFIVGGDYPTRQIQIILHEGIDTVGDHLHGSRGHLRDVFQLLDVGLVYQIDDDFGDVRRLISDALQIGDHFQYGGDETQITSHWLLLQQNLQAEILDLFFLVIDLQVEVDGPLSQFHVLSDQGFVSAGDRLYDHATHLDEGILKVLQLFFETTAHCIVPPVFIID